MTQLFQSNRSTLADCMPELVATARGDLKATLALVNVNLVNVVSGEILPGMSIAIQGSRIAYVGKDITHAIDENTKVIDGKGKYAAPGLLDGHCHIESTQLTVSEFAKAVLPLGTTGGFFDAHEISNVMGLKGLRFMLEEARTTPLAAYMQVASCVPSTHPGLETTGAFIGPEEVAEALSWGPDMIGLGEVMNFPGVVYGDDRMIREIQATLRAGKYADGHFTWKSDDWRLPVYAASGVSGDHECVTKEDVIERIRLGMYAKMRQGSAWHDVAETIKAHTESGIDTRRMMLVTDDRSSESLLREGHMNFVVRHAIAQGVKPVTAFQMATINTAERFGVARDIGSITPGSCADIILLDGNLADVDVVLTIASGQVVAENGVMTTTWEGYNIPKEAFETVHIGRQLGELDFQIVAPIADGSLVAKAIEVVENHVDTRERKVKVKVENHHVNLDSSDDLCKMGVFERHGLNGGHALGILKGLGLNIPAAIAMTVAHDSHNLTVIGNDDELMAKAGNLAAEMQGGVVMVTNDEITSFPLPVGGLMSPEPFETVALQSEAISHALIRAGCTLNNAFMTLSLLALVVIPEIRLSDKGLVRISADGIDIVPLFDAIV
ncbi:adenine deaminase [Paenibacillus macquariensis]|uniref:Adenine deaminase n=1 Tax=Paenibacillus macquariensis TaxID=948756 RepID=A0ABY1KBD3_9BACL|nr:adenine deaminase C-terminal domain-containing protein [Paenibacillus macquariensis]MEC0094240.1 adenine deaminase C-terminal domain-containing protein [Paenibacillus macquariensis]OAB32134.1 adenosine deaminase [Paenibacillus macquariensis subsp. macquariensis]SIR55016.1 Adenine deaminase [Paenibacillus macquariensis]